MPPYADGRRESDFEVLIAKLDNLAAAQVEIKGAIEKHTDKLNANETRIAGVEFSMRENTNAMGRLADEKRTQNGRVGALELWKEQHVIMHSKLEGAIEQKADSRRFVLTLPGIVYSCFGVLAIAATLIDRFWS